MQINILMKRILFILLQLLLFQFLDAQTIIKITTESVYMRESANQNSKVLKILPEGTTVTIGEDCDCDWISVSYDGEIGYIRTLFLEFPPNKEIKADGEGFYIVNSSLNLRTSPNTNSRILGNFHQGQTIHVKRISGNWAEVNISTNNNTSRTAYVHKNYIRKASKSQVDNYKSKQNSSIRNTGGIKYYTNTYGERVQSPTYYNAPPAGATALCRDGTYSFSQNRRGTCSHHGGVARWL